MRAPMNYFLEMYGIAYCINMVSPCDVLFGVTAACVIAVIVIAAMFVGYHFAPASGKSIGINKFGMSNKWGISMIAIGVVAYICGRFWHEKCRG